MQLQATRTVWAYFTYGCRRAEPVVAQRQTAHQSLALRTVTGYGISGSWGFALYLNIAG